MLRLSSCLSQYNPKNIFIRMYRNSKNFEIDKIMLIYKYGSKKARKIAVDEKLKMI